MILHLLKEVKMELNKKSEIELYEDYQSSFYGLMRFQCEKAIYSTYNVPENRCKELLLHSWFKCGLKRKLSEILTLQDKDKDYEKAGKELFNYLYDLADEACEEAFLKDKNIEESKKKEKTKRPKYSK